MKTTKQAQARMKQMKIEGPMTWSSVRRSSGLLEWTCKHATGHPDLRSAAQIAKKYGHPVETWTTHGCCRCCERKDFPGKMKKSP